MSCSKDHSAVAFARSTSTIPQRRTAMVDNREEIVVNDIIEIQELESKVSPNIVWST
jgi:hypothetical protein